MRGREGIGISPRHPGEISISNSLYSVFFGGRNGLSPILSTNIILSRYEHRNKDTPVAIALIKAARRQPTLRNFDNLVNMIRGIPIESLRMADMEQRAIAAAMSVRLGWADFKDLSPTLKLFLDDNYFTIYLFGSFIQQCIDLGWNMSQAVAYLHQAQGRDMSASMRNLGAIAPRLNPQYRSRLFLTRLSFLRPEEIAALQEHAIKYFRMRMDVPAPYRP